MIVCVIINHMYDCNGRLAQGWVVELEYVTLVVVKLHIVCIILLHTNITRYKKYCNNSKQYYHIARQHNKIQNIIIPLQSKIIRHNTIF